MTYMVLIMYAYVHKKEKEKERERERCASLCVCVIRYVCVCVRFSLFVYLHCSHVLVACESAGPSQQKVTQHPAPLSAAKKP